MTRWRYVSIAVFCTTIAIDGGAQSPLRTAGIVEVPELFRYSPSPDGNLVAASRNLRIQLRARPAPDGEVVATVAVPDQLESREYDYEMLGALVYARDGSWSLVKTREGIAGWLAPTDAGTFHPLARLVTDGLAYLTRDWDGFISASPGSATREPVPADPARMIVGFLEPQTETATLHPVFEAPDKSARVIRRVTTTNPAVALQTSRAIPHQVLVLERRPGWFRVAPADQSFRQMGTAWLEGSPVWRFHEVRDLAEAQALADRAWGPEDWNVRVVGSRQVGDALWIEVEVLSHSFCVDPRPPAVKARGWVPAHAASGAPNIWFYSRGC